MAADLCQKAFFIDDDDPNEGIRLYRRAIYLDPSLDAAMANLGRIYFRTGAIGAAEIWWERAIETNPRAAPSYYNLGYLRLMRREYPAAIEKFEMSIAIEPAYADAYFNMGNALKALGRKEHARACWRKHIELRGSWKVEAREALGLRVIHGGDE